MSTRRSVWPARAAVLVATTLLAGLAPLPIAGQAGGPEPLFDNSDAVTAGAFVAGTGAAFALDRRLAGVFRDSTLQRARGLQEAAWTFNHLAVPGVFVLSAGMYGVGRLGGDGDLADVGLHMGESVAVGLAVTYAVKILVGRARPSVDIGDPFDFGLGRGLGDRGYRAFPSGHTTIAFAAAAAGARELDRLWPGHGALAAALTYGPATLVGLARMFDTRHWASDVIFGAAIGSFAGWKTVQYNHDEPNNALNRWFLGASLVPGDWGSVRLALLPAP